MPDEFDGEDSTTNKAEISKPVAVSRLPVVKKIQRLPPDDWDTVELNIFSSDNSYEIETRSNGLTEQEVCDYWGIDYVLLEGNDKWFFDVFFKRGRHSAKFDAVNSLFKQMKQKGGKDAVMEYLVRFTDDWEEDVQTSNTGRKYILELK